jgi:hypothetical protein
MKHLFILLITVILAACSGVPRQLDAGQAFPVVVTHLGASVDANTAQVDVHITAKNGFPRTLKTLRVFVALYDASGARIGADEAIEILGPINNGQSIGPLEKVTSVKDRSVTCVGVVRVEAVMMDYATRILSGAAANALVADRSAKRCGPALP